MTGRKGLFVNSVFTSHIKDMHAEESRHLLSYLYTHVLSPDFQVRLRWQPGTIAFWDNRCTQHYAVADYHERRRMERVTLTGEGDTF